MKLNYRDSFPESSSAFRFRKKRYIRIQCFYLMFACLETEASNKIGSLKQVVRFFFSFFSFFGMALEGKLREW